MQNFMILSALLVAHMRIIGIFEDKKRQKDKNHLSVKLPWLMKSQIKSISSYNIYNQISKTADFQSY